MNDAQDNAATTKPKQPNIGPKATGAPLRMVPSKSKSKKLIHPSHLVGLSPEKMRAIDRAKHWDTRSGHKIPPSHLVGLSPEKMRAIDRQEYWDTRSGPRPFGQPEEEEPLQAKSAPKRKKKPDAKSAAAKKKPKQVT